MKHSPLRLLSLLCLVAFGLLLNARAQTVRHSEISIDPAALSAAEPATLQTPLTAPEPFLALGAKWQAASALRLRVRASVDGATWSEWLEFTIDGDATTPDEFVSGLLLLDRSTRFIQYRFVDKQGFAATARSLHFSFISPGATPREPRGPRAPAPPQTMSQEQKYPKPPVVTRTEWGCPDGQVTTHGALSYTTVTHLIVHHTATGNTAANNDWAAVMRSIWNLHIFTNGWADIGYNYLIDPNGVIYEGRAGGDNVLGAHFSGVNAGTMGVSLIGTFTSTTPTERALASLRKILAWKASQRNLDPAGAALHAASGRTLNVISGHRDGPGSTECPGNALYPLLPALRTEVKSLLTNTGAVASVSAASFNAAALASESIVAAFGADLATAAQTATSTPLPTMLGGTTVTVRDSAGVERFAPLFFVSPTQVNYLLPAGLSAGPATVIITNGTGRLATGTVNIATVAPSLFAANANGKDVAAAVVLRVKADGAQQFEPVAQFDAAQNKFVAVPIDLGAETEQVFLVAFGTGLRFRSALTAVTATLGGVTLPVSFAGPVNSLFGLDQVNLLLPRSLAGRGEVELVLRVDGQMANQVKVQIR